MYLDTETGYINSSCHTLSPGPRKTGRTLDNRGGIRAAPAVSPGLREKRTHKEVPDWYTAASQCPPCSPRHRLQHNCPELRLQFWGRGHSRWRGEWHSCPTARGGRGRGVWCRPIGELQTSTVYFNAVEVLLRQLGTCAHAECNSNILGIRGESLYTHSLHVDITCVDTSDI